MTEQVFFKKVTNNQNIHKEEEKPLENEPEDKKTLETPESETTVKTKIKELAESTVIHGIPKILKSKNIIIKILWIIFFLAAIASCSYMIASNITDFYNYDVISKTEIITETRMLFPTVTICNIESLVSEYAQDLEKKYAAAYDISLDSNSTEDLNANMYDISYIVKIIAYKNFTDQEKQRLGHNLSEILSSCQFGEKNCSASNFSWYFDLNFGNCYQFNSGYDHLGNQVKLSETINPGPFNGLMLDFLFPLDENQLTETPNEGLTVYIHNHTEEPTLSNGVDVKKGELTKIAIQKTHLSRQPQPYSSCQDLKNFDSVFYKKIIEQNLTYSQIECFYLCVQKRNIEKCGCYDVVYLEIDNSPPCTSSTQLKCIKSLYSSIFNGDLFKSPECLALCPLECDSIEFDLFLSSSNYPSKKYYTLNYADYKGMTFEEVKQNSLALRIYYPYLRYTRISESPKTSTVALFSNIGGLLGLFAGNEFLFFV